MVCDWQLIDSGWLLRGIKMKKMFLLAALCLAGNIVSSEVLHAPFPEGERVVCFGDSITHGGMYPYYLQLMQLLRRPGSDVRVLNAGISGGSAGGAIRRWPWDVKPMKGTTTLIVFGMNDVNRPLYGKGAKADAPIQRKAAIDRYAENMQKLSVLVAAEGGKVIIATPPPFDEYNTRQKSERSVGCNEEGLATLADIGRKLAADRKYGSVELHRPLTEVLKIAGEKVYLPDRIHPGADGHLLILEAILHSLGVSPEVAYCEVNLADGKNVLRNSGVSQLKIAPEKV
jgi:lysophospholipase L1-like esterase